MLDTIYRLRSECSRLFGGFFDIYGICRILFFGYITLLLQRPCDFFQSSHRSIHFQFYKIGSVYSDRIGRILFPKRLPKRHP
jgi:hypothetical protein